MLNLPGSLSKYHFAQFSEFICVLMSSQLNICCLSTPRRQISLSSVASKLSLHTFISKENPVVGHLSTQTCGVWQPTNGVIISVHFLRSKKNKYGLSITVLSMPHFRPAMSAGIITRSKLPYLNAGIDTN